METKKPNETPKKSGAVVSNVRGIKNAFLVIIACFIVALCIFLFLLGNPDNFNEAGHPINLLGTVYMGGFVVPILQCCFLTVIVLSVERWIALSSAKGKGSIPKFVANVKKALAAGNIAEAQNLCRKQQGSVGAIVYATLLKYDEMDKNTILEKEQKITMIQKVATKPSYRCYVDHPWYSSRSSWYCVGYDQVIPSSFCFGCSRLYRIVNRYF